MRRTPAAPANATAPAAAVFIGAAAPVNAIGLPLVLALKTATLPVPVGRADTAEDLNPLLAAVPVGAGVEAVTFLSTVLKALLMIDPTCFCIGAGTLLAQAGSGVAVAKSTTKDTGFAL